jgi:hypothetical protein
MRLKPIQRKKTYFSDDFTNGIIFIGWISGFIEWSVKVITSYTGIESVT